LDKKEAGEFLKVDDEIKQVIDWDRRFDFMQQHSGQHLISCLLEQEFNNGTKCM
jgi:Ser-tRNA(Ala) deacylase AlaX